jgi:hypothetical protein
LAVRAYLRWARLFASTLPIVESLETLGDLGFDSNRPIFVQGGPSSHVLIELTHLSDEIIECLVLRRAAIAIADLDPDGISGTENYKEPARQAGEKILHLCSPKEIGLD